MSSSANQFDPGAFAALAVGTIGAAFTFTSLGGVGSLDLSALVSVLASGGVLLGTLVAYGRFVQP